MTRFHLRIDLAKRFDRLVRSRPPGRPVDHDRIEFLLQGRKLRRRRRDDLVVGKLGDGGTRIHEWLFETVVR